MHGAVDLCAHLQGSSLVPPSTNIVWSSRPVAEVAQQTCPKQPAEPLNSCQVPTQTVPFSP